MVVGWVGCPLYPLNARSYLDCPLRDGLYCPTAAEVTAFRDAVFRGDIWWHAFPHNAELATMSPETITEAVYVVCVC